RQRPLRLRARRRGLPAPQPYRPLHCRGGQPPRGGGGGARRRRRVARPRGGGAAEIAMNQPPDPARFVRPELRALGAYHLDLTPSRHKLDQNEVPWDLPRRLKVRMAERLLAADWARYPDFHADELRRALARLHGHPFEGVLVGNGSNELLSVALTALTTKGGEVLGGEPSFGLYSSFV